jgi:hypothetical protein
VRLTLLATFAINATKVFISNLGFALRVQQTVTTVQMRVPVWPVKTVFKAVYAMNAIMVRFRAQEFVLLAHLSTPIALLVRI